MRADIETENATTAGLTEKVAEERKGEPVELQNRKRETDTKNIEEPRKDSIGLSLDDDGDAMDESNMGSTTIGETRKSNDEPEVNLDEALPTRTGNVIENGAALEANNENRELITRSAIPTTSEAESTPEHRSAISNPTTSTAVNLDRSAIKDEEITRKNREDNISKSATSNEKELEVADAAVKSGKESAEAAVLPKSRSGSPITPEADDSKSGLNLQESNAEELTSTESRTGKTTSEAETTSEGTLEIGPELNAHDNSERGLGQSSTRTLSDDESYGSDGSRSGLPSEAAKEATSTAGM